MGDVRIGDMQHFVESVEGRPVPEDMRQIAYEICNGGYTFEGALGMTGTVTAQSISADVQVPDLGVYEITFNEPRPRLKFMGGSFFITGAQIDGEVANVEIENFPDLHFTIGAD